MARQKESVENQSTRTKWKKVKDNGSPSVIYGLGFLGALVYYLQHATTFALILLGILKAIVWPALLIYQVFTLLKM